MNERQFVSTDALARILRLSPRMIYKHRTALLGARYKLGSSIRYDLAAALKVMKEDSLWPTD